MMDECNQQKTFVLTTVGTVGDVTPFFILGQALKQRGHTVTLLTHCAYATECQQAGLGFAALDTPAEYEALIQDGDLLNTGAGVPQFLRRHIIPAILPQYEIIRSVCKQGSVIVGRSTPGIAARMAAENLRIPFVSVLIAPHHIITLSIVAELSASLFASELNDTRTTAGLPAVDDWAAWWANTDWNLGLWPEWFSPLPPSFSARTMLAGFLMPSCQSQSNVPEHFLRMLDGGEPPVLITGGTGVFGGKEFYTVAAKACEAVGKPTILLNRLPAMMPDTLPSAVQYFENIPSLGSYMPQMAAIIHHGGINTTSQAMSAGIPQIILAAGGDRPDNAARAQRLGVAEFFPRPRWDADAVAQGLQRMITSETVRQRCQEVVGWFQQHNAITTACDALEKVVPNTHSLCIKALDYPATLPRLQRSSAQVAEKSSHLAGLSPEQQALLAARLREKRLNLERN